MNLGKPIAEGNTAKIYLVDNKVIKVFNDHLPESESAYEASKQNFAYSTGLSVPKILDLTNVDGKQAIIMEYIDGKTLGDLMTAEPERADYYLDISVDIQRKIHKNTADSIGYISEKLGRAIQSAKLLDTKQKSFLLEKLGTMNEEKQLCHGDFHVFNLIMAEDGEVTIIDWVDASSGDIRADVYRSYLLYSQVSKDIAELYLGLYCKKSGLSKEEVFEWAPIIAGARLSEIVPTENPGRLLDIVNYHLP